MDRTRLGIRFAILFLAVAYPFLSGPSHVFSQEGANPDYGEAMITMDFQDVDLTVLIKFISELTGKNFILDEKIKGKKVTVISPTKISKDEAYKVFESILEIKDLATVPAGSVIKIVPTKDAMEKSLRTVVGKERAPESDMLITRLVSLEYVDPDEMVKILKPLMSRESKVDAYGPTNTLILTETSSNITRLMRIVKQLDIRADEMEMDVIPLEYASAEAMARQLQEILQTLASSTAPGTVPIAAQPRRTARRTPQSRAVAAQGFSGKIIADDRTNSLIVLASETQLEEIRELVHKLDYDTPRAYGNINVFYLEYSNAEDTATVLSDLVSGARSLRNNGPANKGATTPPGVARTMDSFEGEVSVTADIATNSLIIVATPRDYLTLKNVIEKLDIRRKQVYVEAVIMEIQPSVLQELGVEYRGAIPLESGDDVSKVLIGGTNFGLGADDLIGSATALSSGTIPDTGLFPLTQGTSGGLNLGGVFDRVKVGEDDNGNAIYLPANTLVIHALNQTTKANLLSTPHLIAMDNEEAEIVVGRNVPFITSTSQTTVSTVQTGAAGERGDHPPVHPPDHGRGLYPTRALPGDLVAHRQPGRAGPEPRRAHHLGTEVDEHGPRPGRSDDHRGRPDGGSHPDKREQGALAGRHPRARLAVPLRDGDRGKTEPPDLPHAHDHPGGPGRAEAVRRQEEPDARVQGPSRPAGRVHGRSPL